MLTLVEFRATAHRVTIAEAIESLRVDEGWWSDTDAAVWLYAETLFITEQTDGTFHLLLERDEWTGDRATLERILYLHWYLSECEDEYTTAGLTEALNVFCDLYDLPLASADELLADACKDAPQDRTIRQRQVIEWLQWFCDCWEDVQRREDNAAFGNRA